MDNTHYVYKAFPELNTGWWIYENKTTREVVVYDRDKVEYKRCENLSVAAKDLYKNQPWN